MPRRREQKQLTLRDILALHIPDTTPLEVEYQDAAGYHRARITGAWESENGAVVLSAGKDVTIPGRTE